MADEEDIVEVPLEWFVPDGVPTHYVTNVVVQNTTGEFVVSFFEALAPIILGNPDEVAAQRKLIKTVRARCVARVVLTPNRMESMINALVQNYTGFMTREGLAMQFDKK